jgi:hypothetical protein
MTQARQLAIAFAAARGAYGLGLMAAPAKLASGWIGGDAERIPTRLVVRALGARDLAIAGGTVAAALDGSALRPLVLAAIACDLSDIGATLAAGDALPKRARPGTIALAGLSVLAGTALAAAADR